MTFKTSYLNTLVKCVFIGAFLMLFKVGQASNNNDTLDIRFAQGNVICSDDSFYVTIQVRNQSDSSIFLGGVSARFEYDTALLGFPPNIEQSFLTGTHGIASTATLGGDIVWTYTFLDLFYNAPIPNDGQWHDCATIGFPINNYDTCIVLDWRVLNVDDPPITTANENQNTGGFFPSSFDLWMDEHVNYSACLDTICNGAPDAGDPTGQGITTDTFNITIVSGDDSTLCFPITNIPDDKFTNDSIVVPGLNGPNTSLITTAISNDTCLTITTVGAATGDDTLVYIVCDQTGMCDTVTIFVTVVPPANPPVILNQDSTDAGDTTTITINEDSVVTLCYLVVDVNGDSTFTTATTINGSTSVSTTPGTGMDTVCVTFTPNPNDTTTDVVTIIACDTSGLCDTTTIVVNINPVDDPPVITDTMGNDPGDTTMVTIPEDSSVTLCYVVTDADGDSTFVTATSVNGTVVGTTSGDTTCITFTPDPNDTTDDVITIIACDTTGLCDTLVVVVDVVPVPDAPIIVDTAGNDPGPTTSVTTPEDSSITLCYVVTDADGDSTFATASTSGGTLSTSTNGDTICITVTPDPNDTTPITVTVIGCDTTGLCDTLTITVGITPANDPPVITDTMGNDPGDSIMVTIPEDSMITLCYVVTDPDGDSTFVTATTVNGMVVSTTTGDTTCITYTPDPNDTTTDVVTIIACDTTSGDCDTLTVVIDITPVPDAPIIVDTAGNDPGPTTSVTTPEDSSITLCYVVTDADGDSTFATASTSGGTLSTSTNGDTICITVTPDPNDTTPITVTVIGCDITGLCDTLTITVGITPANDPPVITDTMGNDPGDSIMVTIPEDSMITLCYVVTDPDGDSTFVTATTVNGMVVSTTTGDTTCITYTPDPNDTTTDVVTIIACDTTSGDCDTLTVVIDITPVPDAPIIVDTAGNDPGPTTSVTTPEDSSITLCYVVTDADGDSTFATASTSGGTLSTSTNGDTICITVTPDPNDTTPITVTVIGCDTTGLCDTLTITVGITPVNDPPVITDTMGNDPGDSIMVTIPEDSMITLCYVVTDPDGDSTFVTATTVNGMVVSTTTGDTTCITYTPNPNDTTDDVITIIACDTTSGDCDTLTVVIDITPVPDAPVILDTAGNDPGATATINVTTDSTVVLCYQLIDVDGDSTFAAVSATNGTSSIVQTGDSICITYTSALGDTTQDTLVVIGCDTTGLCDTLTIYINLSMGGFPPIITDTAGNDPGDTIMVTIPEDSVITLCYVVTDPDGDSTFVTATTVNGMVVSTTTGDTTCITYTPNPNDTTDDVVTIIACDTTGDCDTLTIVIDVVPVNDPPIITDTAGNDPGDTVMVTMPEDSSITLCYVVTDPDGDSTFVTATTVNGMVVSTTNGDTTCITYTPNPNDTTDDVITIVACDTMGACDTLTIVIDVVPVNDPPVITDTAGNDPGDTTMVSIPEDSTITLCYVVTDADGDSTFVTATTVNGMVVSTTTGDTTCITYTPNPNDTTDDVITIIACDTTSGDCDTLTVVIDIIPVNDPPVISDTAGNDPGDTVMVTIPEDSVITLCYVTVDADGDSVVISSTAINGTVVSTTTGDTTCFTFTPNPNDTVTDVITIIACDSMGGYDTLTIVIDITPVNDPPVVVDPGTNNPLDTINIDLTWDQTVDTCLTVIDVDGDPVVISAVLDTTDNGTFTTDSLCLTYDPMDGFVGSDTAVLVVCDSAVNPMCDTIVVVFTVSAPAGDSLYAGDDSAQVNPNNPVDVLVLNNDTSFGGDSIWIADVDTPANGTVVINGDTINYTPDADFVGKDTFSYVITDGLGGFDTAVVVICVEDPNAAVISNPDTATLPDGTTPVDIDVLPNDVFPPGATNPTVTVINGPNHGTAVVNGDGSITYTPTSDTCGITDTIWVEVCVTYGTSTLCDTSFTVLTYPPCPPVGFELPNAFSPDGNGIHDNLEIPYLIENPANVRVYNRWGDAVWNSNGAYQQNWDGKNDNGQNLPDGTYFLTIESLDGSFEPVVQCVTIHRAN